MIGYMLYMSLILYLDSTNMVISTPRKGVSPPNVLSAMHRSSEIALLENNNSSLNNS